MGGLVMSTDNVTELHPTFTLTEKGLAATALLVPRVAFGGNERGNNTTRKQRREWLIETYRADRDLHPLVEQAITENGYGHIPWAWLFQGVPAGQGEPACRCYRCGVLLTVVTVTADRITPGVHGGEYGTPTRDRREKRTNIRPACDGCNSRTGGGLRRIK